MNLRRSIPYTKEVDAAKANIGYPYGASLPTAVPLAAVTSEARSVPYLAVAWSRP